VACLSPLQRFLLLTKLRIVRSSGIAKVSAPLLRMDAARIARGVKRRWMDKTFPYGACYRDEAVRFDRLYLVRDPWSLSGCGAGLQSGQASVPSG
jgi:hypothetical protein